MTRESFGKVFIFDCPVGTTQLPLADIQGGLHRPDLLKLEWRHFGIKVPLYVESWATAFDLCQPADPERMFRSCLRKQISTASAAAFRTARFPAREIGLRCRRWCTRETDRPDTRTRFFPRPRRWR